MLILPDQNAVFVAVPRTASKSMTQWLERALRSGGAPLGEAESLHDHHASLGEAVDVSGWPLFRMWSFCVVRNPFDRLVSWAAMSDPAFSFDPRASLEALLDAEPSRWTLPQVYFADGVTQVYRFEELDRAVADLQQRFEIDESFQFLHEHETDREPYRRYFDGELRAEVQRRYAADFEAFGYRF